MLWFTLLMLLVLQTSTGRYCCCAGRSTFCFNKPPHIPCSHWSIRPPLVAQLVHLRGPRQLFEIVKKLNTLTNPKIVHRKHIGSVKRENHEHVNRPGSNPIDHRQHCEERLVIHIYNRWIGQNPILVLPRQVMEVASFSTRNPNLPKLLRG